MSAQAWLNRIWYERPVPPWWLRLLSRAYGALAAARRYLYRERWRRSVRLSRPVVVVGNLSVGGTGKTPLVTWLALRLAERGRRPGIVTRGYGGSSRRPRLVAPADDARLVGDEALLILRRTGLPVATGRDRPAAAQLLIDAGCDVILSDDGLQHYALARDCEIVVVDGARRFGNGWLLPAGPLREAPARLASADAVVINGGGPPPAGAIPMRLHADRAVALAGGSVRPLNAFAGIEVHAIAGIGYPERFFNMLRASGIRVVPHARGDHAPLGAADISFTNGNPVLMTEKDAVKCESFADTRHWYVPVDAVFDDAQAKALLDVVTHGMGAHE